MLGIAELFEKLKPLKVADLLKRPFSEQETASIESICDQFLMGPPRERETIRSFVTPDRSFIFLAFSKAMAVIAVRQVQVSLILKGLASLAIEDCTFDVRDSTIPLALLYHSAVKIGSDPQELLVDVAGIAGPRGASLFRSFADRTSENRDIGKFGFKEGTDAVGKFDYVSKRPS